MIMAVVLPTSIFGSFWPYTIGIFFVKCLILTLKKKDKHYDLL